MTAAEDAVVAAWTEWDRAAAMIGRTAAEFLAAGRRPPRLSADTLARSAAALTAAQEALGLPLGWCTRVGSLRWRPDGRERMDPGSAIRLVLQEHADGTLPAALDRAR